MGDTKLEIAAWHEAGHVVMRHLLGLPATKATIEADGSGFTEGSGTLIDGEQALLLCLAGPAAEANFEIAGEVDFENSASDDLEQARGILARCPWFNLRDAMNSVCERLLAHVDAVEAIAVALLNRRELHGAEVVAILREYPVVDR